MHATLPSADPATPGLLEVRGLSKAFRGLQALDDYSLNLPPLTIHGVIGPNGAGKTTLFHLLSGFLRPSSGSVRFDGQDITGSPAYRVARLGIGRTFQNIRLFGDLSVLDNVMVSIQRRQRPSVVATLLSDAVVPAARGRAARRGGRAARTVRARRGPRPTGSEPAVRRPAATRDRPCRRAQAPDPPPRRAERRHEPDRDAGSCSGSSAGSATSCRSRSSSSPTTSRSSWACATGSRSSTTASSSPRAIPASVRANPEVIAAYLGKARHA